MYPDHIHAQSPHHTPPTHTPIQAPPTSLPPSSPLFCCFCCCSPSIQLALPVKMLTDLLGLVLFRSCAVGSCMHDCHIQMTGFDSFFREVCLFTLREWGSLMGWSWTSGQIGPRFTTSVSLVLGYKCASLHLAVDVGDSGGWTQVLMLTRQTLYLLSYASSSPKYFWNDRLVSSHTAMGGKGSPPLTSPFFPDGTGSVDS